jgi:two-component system chemotaxis sensor kinase CheA
MNSPVHNATQTFRDEAEELLSRIEKIALEFQPDEPADEIVNELFRAFHTIKGSGAMFGFHDVASFTHYVETTLDQVREGVLAISDEVINLILLSKDHIQYLLEGSVTDEGAGTKIITALTALLPSGCPTQPGCHAPSPKCSNATADATTPQSYRVHFRPPEDLMVCGTNPAALLNELRDLGDCCITGSAANVPPLDRLRPDHCYLSWEIQLTTNRGLNAIKDVFLFVEDGSDLRIENASAPQTTGACTGTSSAPSPEPLKETRSALSIKPEEHSKKQPAKDSSVRVPSERLDRLVNLVGELVMNQSRLSQVAAGANMPTLAAPVEDLERLVDELRDNVLGIRMMPIGTTFSRFTRLVHDLSAELHKEIDLVTEGAETELDKTVLEQLGDPLVHLIRNSIDHGIEPSDVRLQAGKPRRGTIRLSAAHIGSNVVITIADDGRGLDRDAIHTKAIEKGIISPNAALSERETFDLIFRPGFSTAKQVTGVSGRGVGMDVVKRQFETLRGQIAITSVCGCGTTITLTLPLTLAIIDGLLVEIETDQFIIPMSVVTENVELRRADRSRNNGRNVVAVRGELIPYIRLREAFGITGNGPEVEKVVVARDGNDRVGIVVDRVLGSHQTVIQPLGRFFRDVAFVSGATIMGDGRVALILDLRGLIRAASDQKTGGAIGNQPSDYPTVPTK